MNNKMRYSHTVDTSSAMRRNKAMIHATPWTDIENVMLSEISPREKDKYCSIPLL